MIETKSLIIYTASREQMEAFISEQSADVLKEAYTEMLNGCLAHPDQWEWYAIWMIELKDGTHIGELCFKGITNDGTAEIGYGIAENYQGCGYATEAVSALADWALRQPGLKCVAAETEESNKASQKVLNKAGFKPTGEIGDEGPRFARYDNYIYLTLRDRPDLKDRAADWFHSKWNVPTEAYLECMNAYLGGTTEYGWYLCLDGDEIVGGMGVIENDFHDRKDLAPNVCAVYTEERCRCQGIAGRLLNFVVEDMRSKGISPLYLITDHTSFYERYGWEFFCMVQGDGESKMSRMYIHR